VWVGALLYNIYNGGDAVSLSWRKVFNGVTKWLLFAMYAVALGVPALLVVGEGLGSEGLYLRLIMILTFFLNACILFAGVFQQGHLKYLRLIWLALACVPLAMYLGLPVVGTSGFSPVGAASFSAIQAFPVGYFTIMLIVVVPMEFAMKTGPLVYVIVWAVTTAAGYAQWFIALPWLTTKVGEAISNRCLRASDSVK
jgi:hypothetical protein